MEDNNKKTINKRASNIYKLFINKRINYDPIEWSDYYKKFGIDIDNTDKPIVNKDILEKAYSKAWENRDFEINKLWTRAAYFWGFIVLTFGGYITLLTSAHPEKAIDMHLDLYLLLLGLLFSITWYLVMLGSKTWQHNWEAHIDRLENYISGPIYKTVYYSGARFYSVSKLNEIIALVVIMVWGGLLIQYSKRFSIVKSICDIRSIDWFVTSSTILTILIAIVLCFGYCLGEYRSKERHFFDRWG
jgi:hypothetical protein